MARLYQKRPHPLPVNPEMARIGRRIQLVLTQYGRNQLWLAQRAGLARGAVSEIIHGQRKGIYDLRLRRSLRRVERALAVPYGTFVPLHIPAAGRDPVGSRLRAARVARGLSQPDLASLSGVDQARISRAERGNPHVLGPKMRADLSMVLGTAWCDTEG